ncbi:tripartite tricarboxylate transporter TctB family protein [Brevibacterium sp. FME17]|uniref:tripartite tricarboxylate transporter TctB family protein n=1 Tax=Brevibacterium sp. FME17 TaxID=2742606 RepID=UPI001868A489|nr:tripartite tricarboxylate transporter TctB family protein [Brevibacterium sp. FME17]
MSANTEPTATDTVDEPYLEAGSRTTSAGISTIVLGFLAVFFFINALLLPSSAGEDGIGPKSFPVVVGIVLLCTTILGIVAILRGGVEVRPVGGGEILRVGWCIVLFGLYAASVFLIGFVEASVIFSMLVSMTVFGVRLSLARACGLFAINIVIAMVLFLIFDVWLNVLLPVGWLEYWVFGGLQL